MDLETNQFAEGDQNLYSMEFIQTWSQQQYTCYRHQLSDWKAYGFM
jgi:hypothetical protein